MKKKFYNESIENSLFSADSYKRFSPALTYTFKQGDGQRLNKNGILTVYNFNEPIEIPVTGLLGKWKEGYVGLSVSIRDGKWVKDKETGVVEMKNNPKYATVKVEIPKRGILKYKHLNMIKKVFSKKSV